MKQVVDRTNGQHPIVMIVDDNPAIRDMVSWALELDGYEPVEAAEGQEALTWIDKAACEGRYPALILLDLAMPGMDGDTFLDRLQVRWGGSCPLPAIVIITAAAADSVQEDLPVQHVIVKPFHVRDLLDVVRSLVS